MKDKTNVPLENILRQKAEEFLQKNSINSGKNNSDFEILKFVDELEIHQIELEMQKEELHSAMLKAEIEAEKYTNLYDFAPSGYFTLSKKGEILELNLSGASLLGKERSQLLHEQFAFFIAEESKPTFNLFLEKLFESKTSRTCEIVLSSVLKISTHVYLTGTITDDVEQCLLTMVDITNSKKAAEILKIQMLLQSTLESQIDTIIFSIDKEYNYLSFNKAHSDTMKLAYNADVKVGMNILDSISSSEDRLMAKVNFDRALRGETHSNIRVFGDFEKAHYESFFNPIVDVNHKIIGATGLARNITKRIQNEENLKISEEKYRTLFETNRDSITIFRLDKEGKPGTFIEANPATTSLFGYSKKDLLALNVTDIEIESDEKRKSRLATLVANRKVNFETIIKNKRGNHRNVEIETIMIHYLNEPAVMNIARDITERKENEENTKKAQENLTTILEAIPDLLFEVDLEGRIYYFQSYRTDLLYAKESEFLDKKFHELIPADAANACFEAIQEAHQKGFSTGKQYSLDLPQGKSWFELSITPIKNTTNTDPHFIMLVRDITERKEAEEKLRVEKERIHTILELVSNPIFLKDNEHRITFANSAFCTLFGLEEKNIIGKTLAENVPENEREHFFKIDRQVLDTGETDIREEPLTVKGTKHTIITSKTRLLDAVGNKSLVGSIYDITERKKAEEALQKSQEKLQGIFNVANSGIVLIDNSGNFLLFNDWCCKLLGYTRSELQGLNSRAITYPDDLEKTNVLNKKMIEGKIDTYQLEKRYLRKDKSFVWCEISASAIKDQDNNVVNIIGIVNDITERIKNKEALEKSQEKLRGVFDLANSGIILTDLKGKYLLFNNWCTTAFGYTREELNKLTRDELTHPDDLENSNLYFNKLINGKLDRYQLEKRFMRKDKSFFWTEVSVSAIKDKNNKIVNVLGIVNDITEKRAAKVALQESEARLIETQTLAKVGSWETDFTFKNAIWSKETARIYEIDENAIQFSLEQFLSLVHPEDRLLIQTEFVHSIKKNSLNKLEYRIITPSGIEKFIEQRWVIVRDSQDQPLGAVGSCHDITERKNMEIALKDSEKFAIATFDALSSHIAVLDQNGIILSLNRAWKNFMEDNSPKGTKVKSPIGYNYLAICETASGPGSEEAQAMFTGILSVIEREQKEFTLEYPCHSPTEKRWFNARVTNFPGDGDLRIVVAHENITERKLAEENLLESKRFAFATLDALSAHIAILDENGYIIAVNVAWRHFRESNNPLGLDLKSIKGENYLQVCETSKGQNSEEAEAMVNGIHSVMNGTQEEFTLEYPCHSPTEKRWFNARVTRFPGKGDLRIVVAHENITERKLAEESVLQSKTRFSSIINSSPVGMALNDEELNITYLNQAFVDMFGYTKEDIPTVEDWFLKAYPEPKYRKKITEAWFAELKKIKQTGEDFVPMEVLIRCEKGLDKTVLVSANPLSHSFASEYLINFYDITERKQAELALENEKQRLAVILIGTGAGTWEWNIQTGDTIYNERWAEILGYTLDELAPVSYETWQKLSHPDDLKYALEKLEKHCQGKLDFFECEYRMKHKNGNWVWILSRGRINQWDLKGEPLLMSGTHLDITERKLAEKKLIASEKLLNETQFIANMGSYSLDFNSRKWKSSAALDRISGIDSSYDKTIEGLINIIHPDWQTIMIDYFNNEIFTKKSSFNKEYKIIKIDTQEERWVHGIGEILFDNGGLPLRLIGSIQDITERKIVEEKLRSSSEKFQNLVNSIEGIVWEADAFTVNFTYISKQAERLLGFSVEEWYIEGFWANHLHPDDKDKTISYCIAQTKQMLTHDFSYRFISKEGKTIWLRDIVTVVVEDGKPRWLRGVMFDITNLKEANLLLSESEEKYRGLIENSPDGIVIYAEDKIAFMNDEGIRMLGAKNLDEIIGKSVLQFVHPDSLESIIQRMKEVSLDKNASITAEEKFLKINGESFDVEIKAIPTFYERKPAVQVIVHDITLRKKISLELNKINRVYALISQINNLIIRTRSQEELFQEICNIAVDFGKFRMSWIGLLSGNQKIITAAHAGYENGYFTKSNSTSIVDEPEGRGPTGTAMREGRTVICNDITNDPIMIPWRKDALERGYSSSISIPIIVRNKIIGAFNLYSSESNFFSSNEEILLLEKIILNISFALEKIEIEEDRKRTEEKIRQLSQAVEQSPVTIIITNTKGEIEYANPKFEETTGYTLEEVIHQNPRVLKSGYTSPEEYKMLWETLNAGKEWHGDFHNKKKDGSLYWESASISPIVNSEGKTTHYIAIKEDITQRKKVEKELVKSKERAEESDRLKLAFLANMSHEIRTPMNGILGFTELLKEPKLSGKEQQEYIKIIEKSGRRMLNIINDIINISKVESGQIEVSLSETNINSQIKYIYTFFQPEAKQKGIDLIVSKQLASEDTFVKTDREKVYAVLTNLVKNALKFSNEGSIVFGCQRKGEMLEFFVKDTGLGISKSQKKIIFERFRQANETVSRSHEGSGLGLAISKAYVEILGGQIWVKSKEGKGSTFYFTIPLNKPEEKIVVEEEQSDVKIAKTVKDLKVLIVEDDAISKLLITIAVKPYSKEILKASTGIEAVEACRNNPDIDLVMMDINMPEMGGYEATKLIREFNKKLVIIAQTANGMQIDRDNAIAAGCTDYIAKPININTFGDLIHKYF